MRVASCTARWRSAAVPPATGLETGGTGNVSGATGTITGTVIAKKKEAVTITHST